MQLVSREVLLQLASGQGEVNEYEGSKGSFSFQDFMNEYNEVKKSVGKFSREMSFQYSDIEEVIYDKMKKGWLNRHSPPIKFVGKGSSRAAFACSGGKCLKVATNFKGLSQNKQEVKNTNGLKRYACFPDVYDFDSKRYVSLMTECCAKAQRRDFQKLFGFGLDPIGDLDYMFRYLRKNRFDLAKTLKFVQKELAEYEDPIKAKDHKNFLKQLKAIENALRRCIDCSESSDPQWKSLHDLIQFYVDHKGSDNQLMTDDLLTFQNWGLVLRDGGKKMSLIVIDAGFSKQVADKFY